MKLFKSFFTFFSLITTTLFAMERAQVPAPVAAQATVGSQQTQPLILQHLLPKDLQDELLKYLKRSNSVAASYRNLLTGTSYKKVKLDQPIYRLYTVLPDLRNTDQLFISYPHCVKTLNLKTGECYPIITTDSEIECNIIDYKKNNLFIGCMDGTIKFCNLEHTQYTRSLTYHTSPVLSLELDKKNHRLFSGSRAGHIAIWDLHDNYLSTNLKTDLEILCHLNYDEARNLLLVHDCKEKFQIWDLTTNTKIDSFTLPVTYHHLAHDFAKDYLITEDCSSTENRKIKIWNLFSRKLIKKISGSFFYYNQDANLLFSNNKEIIDVWDLSGNNFTYLATLPKTLDKSCIGYIFNPLNNQLIRTFTTDRNPPTRRQIYDGKSKLIIFDLSGDINSLDSYLISNELYQNRQRLAFAKLNVTHNPLLLHAYQQLTSEQKEKLKNHIVSPLPPTPAQAQNNTDIMNVVMAAASFLSL